MNSSNFFSWLLATYPSATSRASVVAGPACPASGFGASAGLMYRVAANDTTPPSSPPSNPAIRIGLVNGDGAFGVGAFGVAILDLQGRRPRPPLFVLFVTVSS